MPRCCGMEAKQGPEGHPPLVAVSRVSGQGCVSSSTPERPWLQNLPVRALCGGSGHQGCGRRYPEHPLVGSVLNVSSHVGEAGKATSPQGHGPGQPRWHRCSCAVGGCREGMQGGDGDFGLGGSPAPARQDGTFGVPASAGRAPEAAAPRLQAGLRSPAGPGSAYSLFPVTAGAGLRATTPHHDTPRRPRCCRASREPGGTTEPAPAPPGCGSAFQHIPFPAFSSAALHIHSQTPVST